MVIENKLDDSGRDVVWQAFKYVAYCSSLKKAEMVEIYQTYLDRSSDGASALTHQNPIKLMRVIVRNPPRDGGFSSLFLMRPHMIKPWCVVGVFITSKRIVPPSIDETCHLPSPFLSPGGEGRWGGATMTLLFNETVLSGLPHVHKKSPGETLPSGCVRPCHSRPRTT